MAKQSEKISVLIPMYNVEQYLARCLDSVINQTYKNLEIIIVDDGSEDQSNAIAEQYAASDPRIKIITQKNGGNAAARNTALKHATGDWLAFIDSDDYVAPTYIETLYKTATKHHADMAICKYQIYDWEHPQEPSGENKDTVMNTAEALKALFYQKDITTGPHCKIYKTELFVNKKFPEGKICEDLAILYQIFARAKKIVLNDQVLYFYLSNPSGTMNKQMKNFRPERAVALDFCEEAVAFVDKNFPELHTAAVNRLFTEAIYIITDIPNTKELAKISKRTWQIIKDHRQEVINDPESKPNMQKYAKVSFGGRVALRAALRAKNKIGDYLGAKQRKKTTATSEA